MPMNLPSGILSLCAWLLLTFLTLSSIKCSGVFVQVYVQVVHFHPSLIFAINASVYQSGAPLEVSCIK